MDDDKDKPFDDQQWSNLLNDWQSQPTKAIDTEALLRRIKRRSWVIWLHSGFDVITIIGAWVLGFYLLFFSDKGKEFTYLVLALTVLGTVLMFFEMRLRKGTWRHHGEGNDSILDFSIRRCEVAIKVGQLFLPAMLAVTVVILTWQAIVYVLFETTYWKLVIGTTIVNGMVTVASRFFIRRKRKELTKLKAML